MKGILSLLLLGTAFTASAQRTAFNRVNVSVTPQYYFNKAYVENDNLAPNPIMPNNTAGYAVGLEYERVFGSGLVVSAGLQYGMQRHDVHITHDFAGFDPQATVSLGTLRYDYPIAVSARYLNPRLTVGYRKTIDNRWAVLGKGGLAMKMFFNGLTGPSETSYLSYSTDDGTYRYIPFAGMTYDLGDEKGNGGRYFSNLLHTIELYLGAERRLNLRYVKSLQIGLEATRALHWNTEANFIQVRSRLSYQQPNSYSTDWYHNRNISVGLRVGVGLWK